MFLEKICRQAAILASSISVLIIVVLASIVTGRGDINTLTVFAETNANGMETAREFPDETEGPVASTKEDSQAQQQRSRILPKKNIAKHRQEEESPSKETARKTGAVVPLSQEDYQILLRIVQAEAGICDDTGKVLVANVILNRVKNNQFPNTIKDVVYQKSQFSPVANGTINTCKVTPQTIDCVNRALSGEDYSQGALYFMNRSGARAQAADWFDGRLTFLFQHERHEFFK